MVDKYRESFNPYSINNIRNLKIHEDRHHSGVMQCQRCLKHGHYTYECQNEVAYTYRPSRTMQYK